MQQIGAGMQAVANGDLGAAAPLVAQAAGLAFTGRLRGRHGRRWWRGRACRQHEESGGEAARGGDRAESGGGEGEGGGGITSRLGLDPSGARRHLARHQRRRRRAGRGARPRFRRRERRVGGQRRPAVGDVGGVDATDRAKGPGHSTSKVAGTVKESIGSVRVAAALTGVNVNVNGNVTETIGAARVEMALGNRAEEVDGSKTESALGLVIITKGDETETVGAAGPR